MSTATVLAYCSHFQKGAEDENDPSYAVNGEGKDIEMRERGASVDPKAKLDTGVNEYVEAPRGYVDYWATLTFAISCPAA